MYAIECSEVEKKYGNKKAIDGLNLQIEEDKIIGLIGRNGAGKTTFLRLCAGLLKPTAGSIKILGKEPFDEIETLSQIVLAGEEIVFDDSYRVREILDIASSYYESWDVQLVDEVIGIFGLDPQMKIKRLSKGMKSMVNTMIALCSRRPLTLFDEPTSGLDAAHRKDFYNLIIKEFSECPRTMIISSHLLSEIEPLLEDILLIDGGSVVLYQSVDELRNCLIQLEGSQAALQSLTQGKRVFNRFEALGKARICVKREDLSEQDFNLIKEQDIQMNSVSSQDACIYLTEKGEIVHED